MTTTSGVPGRRPDLPTGTVTFLFSDIEASTRLVQEVGPDVFRATLEDHHRVMRTAFSANGGVERGTQGDSFAVIFREGPAAVAAAVAAQRALADHAWPPGASVRVRIGLHTGLGIAGGDDYVGVDIHRAARIAGLAQGGQTLVSDATRALVERDLPPGTSLRDLGVHRLRDMTHPERLFEIVVPGISPVAGSLRAAPAGNVPPALTALVGRGHDLDELTRLLEASRLVTIIGPGGIGKTTLALELARRVAADHPDGAWLARLDAVSDGALFDTTVVDALGIPDAGTRTPAARLEDHLANRALLLVLDNLEQLPGVGRRIVDLLGVAPGVRVLATSRGPLGVSAEQIYPLEPLAIENDEHGTPDAVRLFIERARRARPAYAPDAADEAAIAAICRRVDGLPLGIELAAAQVRILPMRAILDRLERRLDLPTPGAADLPARHRTLRDTVAWSYELLDPAARGVLRRLAVFEGGSRLDEVERAVGGGVGGAVGGAPDGDADVLSSLTALNDHSLIVPRSGVDGPRFAMLDTIRSFAGERLEESGEGEDARSRHAVAYLALAEAEAVHLPGREQAVRLERLTEDHDNLRAAVAWSIEAGDAEMGLRFAASLWRFWQLRGHLAEAHAVMPRLLGIPGAERDDVLRLRAIEAAGGIAYWRGEIAEARAHYETQMRIARSIGDRLGEADGAFNLAHAISVGGEGDAAAALLGRAGDLYADLGHERGQARVAWARSAGGLINGETGFNLGPEALDVLTAMHARFEALDDFLYAELCVGSIAWVNLVLGNIVEAARWGGRAMRTSWQAGSVSDTTFSLRAAAIVAAETERWQEAATLLGAYEEFERRFAVRPPVILEVVTGRADPSTVARAHLGDAGFSAAAEFGRAMSFDEAVEYALDMIGSLA
ncbi:MAG TPA: adenylate/guanylate cyclase domain-containing protein [Candidatus Limnocylindrales bacterium]|nr:adenylate/guanylate cyclase domain-containing protein [Candidatus Limnocylindrales bacterium]